MKEKDLRLRIEKIRSALTIITNEINSIYNDNAESEEPKSYLKQRQDKALGEKR